MDNYNSTSPRFPDGWMTLVFGDFIEKISTNGKKIKQKEYLEIGDIPIIDQGYKFIGGFTNNKENALECDLPVIVFGDHTKIIKIVNFRFAPGADGVKIIQPSKVFNPRLFAAFLKVLVQKIPDNGYARHFQHLEKILIPLPPLPEQNRILNKIEELFSELDSGIESLKTAQQQLKIYRQAVLKWAFEGKLTAQWREEQKRLGKLESAEVLLAQIKAEREQRYQQELEDWKTAIALWEANGKEGKRPGKPSELMRILPLSSDELNDLSELPQEWKWVRYGSLCREIRNGISTKPNSDNAEKILRISSVRPFYIDLSDFRHIENLNGIYDNYFLQVGDILFTRYNGSRHYVGVCANFKSNKRFLYPDKLIRTRLISDSLVLPDYIVFAANSGKSRTYIERQIKTTAGQSGISGQDIKLFPIPLCSSQEQRIICDEINTRFSIIDRLESEIETNLKKAEALRQSILKQAFEGKLVPQDPNDEPASGLLGRIQAEREAQKNGKSEKPPKKVKL